MLYDDFLPQEVRSAITQHMLADTSVEACGLITFSKGKYTYEAQDNVHPESGMVDDNGVRMDRFRFKKSVAKRIAVSDEVVAYVHSHPAGPTCPTKSDMETQVMVKKPSVICAMDPKNGVIDLFSFGDHLLDLPLDGRMFRPSVTDCYEHLRSWKWQNEKEYLPPIPRDPYWYQVGGYHDKEGSVDDNADLYTKNFQLCGYEEFRPEFHRTDHVLHPRIGDVLLMVFDAPVINHAAVYIGNNQISHHRAGKRSGPTSLGYLADAGTVRKWVRKVVP